jgi:hypothetical protein
MTSANPTYLPGVHNLNPAETAQRRRGGWFGLVLTILAGTVIAYFHVAQPWRLLIFIPVAMAAIGFLQAGSKFCVMVALSSRSPATNAADRSKDRTKAFRLIAAALFIGAIGAAVVARQ